MANPFEEDVQTVVEQGPMPASVGEPLSPEDMKLIDDSLAEGERDDMHGKFWRQAIMESDDPNPDADPKEFAEINQVDEGKAQQLLQTYSEKDATVLSQAEALTESNPDLVRWAAEKPENYKFLRDHFPELLKQKDTPHGGVVYLQDMGKALQRNMPMLENLVAVGRYSVGELSKEEFAQKLENIRQRRDNQTPYGTDISGFEAAMKKFDREWKQGQTFADVGQLPREDLDDYVKVLVEAMSVSGASVADIVEMAMAAVTNPAGTTLKSIESLGSTIGPTIGAVGGSAVGRIGGPVTSAVGGVLGGTVGSGLVRYAQEVEAELNAYVDANPGATYLQALENPEIMAKVQKIATTYGLVGGLLDTLLTRLGGNIGTKGIGGLALGTGVDIAGEGIAEAGATTAKEVAKGKGVLEAASEGVREGVIESILVAPTSGTMNFIPGMTSLVANRVVQVKRKAMAQQTAAEVKGQMDKVKEDAKKVVKSPEDAAKLRDVIDVMSRKEEVVRAEEGGQTVEEAEGPEETVTEAVEDAEVDIPEEGTPETKPKDTTVTRRPRKRSKLREEGIIERTSQVAEVGPHGVVINPALLYQKYHSVPIEQRKISWEEYLSYYPEYVQEQLRSASDDTAVVFIKPEHWAIANSQGATEDLDEVVLVNTPWGLEPAVPQDEDIKKEDKKKKEEVDASPAPKDATGEKAKGKDTKQALTKKFGRFKSLADENQYNNLKKRITKVVGGIAKTPGKESALTPEAIQIYTDMFYNMAIARAKNLGKPLAEVLGEYEFTDKTEARQGGFVTTLRPGLEKLIIGFNRKYVGENYLNILVHEFGHVLLNNMVKDWDSIMAIPEGKLTPEQEYYRDTMLLTAKVLQAPNLKGVFDRTQKMSPMQEKFATSIELFFKKGQFKDTDTGRLMLRFQQTMAQVMTKDQLYHVGQSYVTKGVSPAQPGTQQGEDFAMVFNSLIDANEKLIQEVYPLIPPPEYDRKDLGEGYEKWMKRYREAVEEALLKVYKEIFNDNIEFYRTHYNETFSKEYEKLLDSPIGSLHNLLKDGYIILTAKDIAGTLGVSESQVKELAKQYGFQLAKNKKEATSTVDILIEQGLLGEDRPSQALMDAIKLEETAVRETIKRLEENNEAVPRQELQNMSNIILSDENISRVRQEAGQKVLTQLRKELANDKNITSTLKKEITKSVSDKVLTRKAKNRFTDSTHPYFRDEAELRRLENDIENSNPGTDFAVLTDTQGYKLTLHDVEIHHTMKKHFRKPEDMAKAKKQQNQEGEVSKALETGEIPELFNAVEQLIILEKKNKLVNDAHSVLNRLNNAWLDKMATVQIRVKQEGQPDIYISNGMIGTAENIQSPFTDNVTVHTIKDNGIYDLAQELMDKRATTNLWSRLKYGHLLNEADLKARVLAKLNFIPAKKVEGDAGVTLEDVESIMGTVDAAPKGEVDAMPLPPIPETKKLTWDETQAVMAQKVVAEVKKMKKTLQEPSNFVSKYIYMDSVGIMNFIASMMDEKDLSKSWLYALFRKVSEAEGKKNVLQRQYNDRLVKAVKKFSKSKKSLKKLTGEKGGLFSFLTGMVYKSNNVIKAPEIGKDVSFTNLGEVITALLYMGSESGRTKLLLGGFVNSEGVETGPLGVDNGGNIDSSGWDAFIKRLIEEGVLTEEAFDLVQEIHDIFTEIFPLVKQSFKDSEGITINFVEGRKYSVTLQDGTKKSYRGGYYPLLPNRTFTNIVEGKGQDAFTGGDFNIVYDNLDASMSRHRGGQIYPLQLGLGSLMGLLNKHLTHAYVKRPLLVIENLKNNKEVAKVFENRQKGFIKNVLNPWIERVARQRYSVPNPSFLNSFALHIRRTGYIALFFLGIRPIVKQFLGVIQAVPTMKQFVGNGRMLKHFAKVAGSIPTGQYRGLRDDIGKMSSYMKDRLDNNEKHLIRGWDEMELTETAYGGLISGTEHYTFMGMQFAQNIVDMGIWLAAYEKVTKEGGTKEQAVLYADGLVERTQASSNIAARPAALYGTNFERLAMMISMVSHGIRGRIYENAARAKDNKQSVALARFNALMWMVVIPTILEHTIYQMIEQIDGEDDDPEIPELMSRVAADSATAYAPQIMQVLLPLIGGAGETVAGVSHPKSGELFGLGPISSPLKKGVRGFNALARSVKYGVPMTSQEKRNLALGIAATTGLPVAPVADLIYTIVEMQKSDAQRKREATKRRKILNKARKRR